MTQGERDSSGGELTSFLHLTGLRPLALLLVAGLAGGIGVFLALGEPATFQARYVLNVDRVADNDLAIGEINLVAEEIVSTASFPEVQAAVEQQTGLVFEDDYEINVNRAGGALININVVADQPEDAQNVAIETGIAAVTFTTERQSAGIESSRDQLESELAEIRSQLAELTAAAGGINPIVALQNAEAALLQRRADILNPPTITQIQADGTILEVEIPYTGPTAPELQAVVDELSPLEREFQSLQTSEAALTTTLSTRNNSIRELDSAIQLIESERDTSLVINEVVTEETSRITGLLTGLLLFAVPAALVVIILFTLFDLLFKKDEPVEAPEEYEPFDAAGALEAAPQRALPESSVRTPLTIVDGEYDDYDESDEYDDFDEDEEDGVIDVVAIEDDDDDDFDPDDDADLVSLEDFGDDDADDDAEYGDEDDSEGDYEEDGFDPDEDDDADLLALEDVDDDDDDYDEEDEYGDAELELVDDDDAEEYEDDEAADEAEAVIDLDQEDEDDDEPPAPKKATSKAKPKSDSKAKSTSKSKSKRQRNKDGRWGRSQNSKAG